VGGRIRSKKEVKANALVHLFMGQKWSLHVLRWGLEKAPLITGMFGRSPPTLDGRSKNPDKRIITALREGQHGQGLDGPPWVVKKQAVLWGFL